MIMALWASAGLAMAGMHTPDVSTDLRLSTFSLSTQGEADVAVASDGAVLGVWSSRRQNGGKSGVFGQWLDADGMAIGEEFSLSLWRENHQVAPAVAASANGAVWAVWQSHGQDGDAGAIVARLLTPNGGSEEILVNQIGVGHQGSPVVAALSDGGAVVAWESTTREGRSEIRYRVFDRSGHPRTDERAVEASAGSQRAASIASGEFGFAIAWSAFDGSTPTGVRVRTFGVDGEAMHASLATGAGIEPVIRATRDGYALAWIEAEEESYGVRAALLDAIGERAGEVVRVNDDVAGVQNAPAIAVGADGRIVIAYNSDDSEGKRRLRVREFDGGLKALSASRELAGMGSGEQTLRDSAGTARAAFDASGRLLIAWSGDAGLGDSSSANLTIAGGEGVPTGGTGSGGIRGVRSEMCAATTDTALDLAAGPHVPPTFSPRDRAQQDVEIIQGPGGVGFLAVTNTGWTPPDPHMAVGLNHVVVMTNGQIAFFRKDGTNTFRDEIEDSFGFWGSVGATGFVFDPEVIYDAAEDRFVAMAAEAFAPGNRSYVLIAISDDGDPNGTWFKYRLETTSLAGDLFDSPNIGVTDTAVVVTGDGFGIGANYPVFTWDKASLYAGSPPAIARQTTLATSTQSAGIPPVSDAPQGVMHWIEHQEGSNRTQVRLIALRNALTTPAFTTFNLTVPSYSAPGDPSQQGTGTRPETFDARFWSVEYVNDHLWATHHVNNTVVVRWYEIDLRGWPNSGLDPVLVQSGTIQPTGQTFTFFSAIGANADGLAGVTYAQSSTSEPISMRTAYRLPSDPLGTMRLGDAQQINNAPYTQTRWGDYSSCDIDPADGTTIWSHHEYALNNSWRTWVASIVTEAPCPADLDGDGDADGDDFFTYLDAFAADNLGVCDIDGDGDCDADDFFEYLDVFSLGC